MNRLLQKNELITKGNVMFRNTPSLNISYRSLFFKNSHQCSTKEQPIEIEPNLHFFKPLPVRLEFSTTNSPLDSKTLEAIDVANDYHRPAITISDKVAYGLVKFLRLFADFFFQKRYVHRAIVLETVAAVPGMVAAMQHDGGWIHQLLLEAENERMHLMTWMKITQPNIIERMLVTAVQGIFLNFFVIFYLISPKTAHRMVGYLEEEAVISYTAFLKEIDQGRIKNTPAPKIAIDYWNLRSDATLRDVVLAVRADEANHRDVNHHLSTRIANKNENLREGNGNGN